MVEIALHCSKCDTPLEHQAREIKLKDGSIKIFAIKHCECCGSPQSITLICPQCGAEYMIYKQLVKQGKLN